MENVHFRPYRSDDYQIIEPWFEALVRFYDGHNGQNKLIDQLVAGLGDGDKNGFFTTRKELWVAELKGQVAGFYCLNYKRGGSVKLGPMITNPSLTGKGIGKAMMSHLLEQVSGERKLYATTNENNHAINSIFDKFGLQKEAFYPDHYKRGSGEIVWGYVLQTDYPKQSGSSLCLSSHPNTVVRYFSPKADLAYLHQVCNQYLQWHDDLGEDFVDAIVRAQERGLSGSVNFQDKSKWILVAESSHGYEGLIVVSPKRGGPAKLYPFTGSLEAQRLLLSEVIQRCQKIDSHKMYSFCSLDDYTQRSAFKSLGFFERGTLVQPYKPGTRLVTVDMHFEKPIFHTVRMYQTYLDMVQTGVKTLEGRCNSSTFQRILPGHRILFQSSQHTIQTLVLARREYKSFAEMIRNEDTAKLLPGHTKEKALTVYLQIPGYAEASKKHGVVVFDVILC